MNTDPKAIEAVKASLLRDAEKSGEGPNNMRKSKFRSELEKQSFIEAFGQAAYDNLEG